jgi:hypothetical protein
MTPVRILVAAIIAGGMVSTVTGDETRLNLKVLATDSDVAAATNRNVKAIRTIRDRLSDQSFVTFAKWPNLYGVYLGNTTVTGTGFHLLDEHEYLVQVVLMGPNVGNEGALTVADLPHVTHLTIGNGIPPKSPVRNARLTDRGLRAITTMPHLAWLVVVDADITDEGVQYLRRLKSIESIVFDYCPRLTPLGIARLQAKLPKTQIRLEQRPTRP